MEKITKVMGNWTVYDTVGYCKNFDYFPSELESSIEFYAEEWFDFTVSQR